MLLFLCAPVQLCMERSLSLTAPHEEAVHLVLGAMICFPLGSGSLISLCLLAEMKQDNAVVSGKMLIWYPHPPVVSLGMILP